MFNDEWLENTGLHVYECNEIDISDEIEREYEREQEREFLEYQLDDLKELKNRNARTSLENFVNDMVHYHDDCIRYDELNFLFDENNDVDNLYNEQANRDLIRLLTNIK